MRNMLWRIRLATTHPESIWTVPSFTARCAKSLMFSVCVQQQNRLSRPPIAVIYSPATWQTRPVPSGDHLLFCHRPAEPVMAGFEIESQIYIYSEDGSKFLRKICTYSPSYTSSHPGRNIHASAFPFLRCTPSQLHDSWFLMISWHPSKEMYRLSIHFPV